jgi:hypothetical protein
MFVSVDELYTHLYPESIEAISGNDVRLLTSALSTGIAEVKGYLHRFDLDKLFGAAGDARNDQLVMMVKDVALWHYINIANPGINYEDRHLRYKYQIATLQGIQRGDIIPDFPLRQDDDGNILNSTGFRVTSNPRRDNHI